MTTAEALIERYQKTHPSTRRRGRAWYPEARRVLAQIAGESDRSVAQAVAVFAITSANTTLASNLRFTKEILAGQRMAGCYPSFQTPQIEAVFSTRYPGRFVRGPKCGPFYKAIMGDVDALVLDRWAARAAGVEGVKDIRPGLRRELEQAYRMAARFCGETVRAFQAIAWLDIRESTPTKRGTVPRLRDITKGENE